MGAAREKCTSFEIDLAYRKVLWPEAEGAGKADLTEALPALTHESITMSGSNRKR